MGFRIHSATTSGTETRYVTDMAAYFDDDEMSDVEAGLVLSDGGNMEVFVIQGDPSMIREFAHRIIDELPLALTEAEQRYLAHICEQNAYDPENVCVSRDYEGIAWMEPDEDAITYDLTNGFQRSRSIEAD